MSAIERQVTMRWVRRLKRVFNIDVKMGVRCGAAVRVIARIEEPALIERILAHGEECARRAHRPRRERRCSGNEPVRGTGLRTAEKRAGRLAIGRSAGGGLVRVCERAHIRRRCGAVKTRARLAMGAVPRSVRQGGAIHRRSVDCDRLPRGVIYDEQGFCSAYALAPCALTGNQLVKIAEMTNKRGTRSRYRQFPQWLMEMISFFSEEVVYPLRYDAPGYNDQTNGYDFACKEDLADL